MDTGCAVWSVPPVHVAEFMDMSAVIALSRRLVETLPTNLESVRDQAVLLLGFAAALRRSELVGLDVPDVAFTVDGVVTLRRSKTDQEGAGWTIRRAVWF